MTAILYPFLILSACGFALSIGVHLMALAGVAIPGGKISFELLHIGIFVVWLPAVLVSMQTTRYAKRKDFWKVALAGFPLWMRRAGYVLYGYAIFNFIVFVATTVSQPEQLSGDAPQSVVRGFSGHWMVFYGTAFAFLYSRIYAPHLYRERRCPQGHAVSPTARYCPDCGYAFPKEPESANKSNQRTLYLRR